MCGSLFPDSLVSERRRGRPKQPLSAFASEIIPYFLNPRWLTLALVSTILHIHALKRARRRSLSVPTAPRAPAISIISIRCDRPSMSTPQLSNRRLPLSGDFGLLLPPSLSLPSPPLPSRSALLCSALVLGRVRRRRQDKKVKSVVR